MATVSEHVEGMFSECLVTRSNMHWCARGVILMFRSAASLASGVAHGPAILASSNSLLLSCNGASKPGLFVEGRVVTVAEPAPHDGAPLRSLEEVEPDSARKSMLQNGRVPQSRWRH